MWWDICISSLKMSFHYDRYRQILIEINEHMILIEIIQGLKEIPNSLTFFYWYLPQYMIILQINHFQLQVGWKVFNWINIFWNMKFSFAFLLWSGKKKKAARTVVWAQKIHLLQTGVGGVKVLSLYILSLRVQQVYRAV